MEQTNEYILTEDEHAMLKPLTDQIDALQRDAQAILRAIVRHRGLEQTNWSLTDGKLVRIPSNGNGNG